MNKTIILSGSNGFIGTHLLKRLKEMKCNVIELNRNFNFLKTSNFKNLPKSDFFIHLVGHNNVQESWNDPNELLNFNLQSTNNVINYCVRNDSTFLFPSSFIYKENDLNKPYSENMEIDPKNPYSFSKYLCEQMCFFYKKNFGLKYNILRLFNVYGPGQKTFFLISSIIDQIILNNKIVIQDLTPLRDFVFIGDVVDAFELILQSKITGETINICSGESYSVEEVISKILKIMNINNIEIINKNNVRLNEIKDSIGDNSKALNLINWYPKVSLDKGLRITIL